MGSVEDVVALGPWTARHVLVVSPALVVDAENDGGYALMKALRAQAIAEDAEDELPLVVVAELDQLHLLNEDAMRAAGWVRTE